MPELSLKVLENYLVAEGTLGLKLELPEAATNPPAGKKAFTYKAGQYAMLTLGEEEARAFSIASSPTRAGHLQFATRDTGSAFKKLWANLKEGDSVKVFGPLGKFIFDESKPLSCFVIGGIGITPVKSMVEYACDSKLANKIVLIYANRKTQDISFKKELDELATANPNFKVVHVLSEAPTQDAIMRNGKIDATLVKELLPDYAQYAFYSCGPPGMVGAMVAMLKEMNVPDEQVKTEHFEGYK